MKIKKRHTAPSQWRLALEFFKKKKFLIRGILGAAGLFILCLLFVAVMGYGAYLTKAEQTSYVKPTLLQISELDFSFLTTSTQGTRTASKKLRLDIKKDDLVHLRSQLEKSMEAGEVGTTTRELVPATLTVDGIIYNVNLGLTKTMPIHIDNPGRWSFQIKAKGDNAPEDMKRFNLLHPSTGEYLINWLGIALLQQRGLRHLKGDFVRLAVNGKDYGYFYLEEGFEPALQASERFKEGILFKLGNENSLYLYEKQQLMKAPTFMAQVASLQRKWQQFKEGTLPLHSFFDLEKTGRYFSVIDLINQRHPFFRDNMIFYYNPISERAEPVIPNIKPGLNTLDPYTFTSFLEEPAAEGKWLPGLTQDSIIGAMLNHREFKRFYLRETSVLCQKESVEELLAREGNQLTTLTNSSYQPGVQEESQARQLQALHGKAKYLRYFLFSDEAEVMAWYDSAGQNVVTIQLRNRQTLPLEITHLSWRDSTHFFPVEKITLRSSQSAVPEPYAFKIPEALVWADTIIPELVLHYNVLGMEQAPQTVLVLPWSFKERLDYAYNPASRNGNHTDFSFVQEAEDGKALRIPAGKWTLTEDLIIPAKKKLNIEAGAQIDLLNHAKIITYSPIFVRGSETHPFVLKSSDATGEGMIIIGASQRSSVQHAVFDRLSGPVDGGWRLSGSLTFYESPVDISYCTFTDNQRGDDFLNIIRADFTIDNSSFNNINADAFDCDFCTGSVTNSSFTNVGNDGIDVSGTEIEISRVTMTSIGDKGLSAGENSRMTAKWIEVRDAEIAVTSKDQSSITISDAQLINTRIGITLFQKKSEFGPGFLTGERIDIQRAEIPYLVEANSALILDGETIPPNKENVKDILYGIEYGKSSK